MSVDQEGATGQSLDGRGQDGEPILSVSNLSVEFATESGWLRVVDDVSFDLRAGETLGLVGESGSGKTVTALALMGLIDGRSGRIVEGTSIRFLGRELVGMGDSKLNRIRGNEIAMIFQEPMVSLNPAFTIGFQIAEAIRLHLGSSKRAAWRKAVEMLELVGIPEPQERAKSYPHQFSGGMAQRAMIAMALSCNPTLLIADEPTTALDVTVEADILDLLRGLQKEFQMGVILVTHDLGVIQEFCARTMVMYAGQIVADASVKKLFESPIHPYVEGLLASIPNPTSDSAEMWAIPGVVPPPSQMPKGCRFHPRCAYVDGERCTTEPVELLRRGNRLARCVRIDELTLTGIHHGS